MLDISIKQIHKVVTTTSKASSFIKQYMDIQEKIDGTKLTLIRNKNPYNKDYTKNWIVSYKNSIIWSSEFAGLKDLKSVKTKSIGTSQYKFVHDHLKKIHSKTKSIPKGTEFFVEFVQNKKTLTRDYKHKHGLFLVGFGKTNFDINKGTLNSVGANLNTDEKLVNKYAKILNFNIFPILFRGTWKDENSIRTGFKNNELLRLFNKYSKYIDFDDPLSIVNGMSRVCVDFQSVLGGKPEGVVIKTKDGKIYKVVQSDQYDKSTRGSKKARYELSREEETQYWKDIKTFTDKIVKKLKLNKSIQDILGDFSKVVYSLKSVPVKHSKKDLINFQDDIFLTGKIDINKKLDLAKVNSKSVALFPMAGRPIHAGHWAVIEKMAKDNDSVIVFASTKDRVKGSDFTITGAQMQDVWIDILKKYLPKNVTLKYSNLPVNDIRRELKYYDSNISKKTPTLSVYSDTEDIKKWEVDIKKLAPNLVNRKLAKTVGIPRTSTVNISGTEMRQFLSKNDKESFIKYLPKISSADKENYWSILTDQVSITDSILAATTDYIKEVIFEQKNSTDIRSSLSS